MGNGSIAPPTPNLTTSVMSHPLNQRSPLNRGLGGPYIRSGRVGEKSLVTAGQWRFTSTHSRLHWMEVRGQHHAPVKRRHTPEDYGITTLLSHTLLTVSPVNVAMFKRLNKLWSYLSVQKIDVGQRHK